MTFFAAAGLTSTSANHIANLAKEYVQAQSQELENVEFYNSFLTIIGSDKTAASATRMGQTAD